MAATEEQLAICQSDAQVMLIKAGAGTGKTTTLRGMAQRNPQTKMLYLAFNRAVKEEAVSKFGNNVRPMTAHGMAFAKIGKEYANTPDKLASGDLKPFHVAPIIKPTLSKIPAAMGNLYGGRVIEAVKAFMVSADAELSEQHLSVSGAPAEKKHFMPERILRDAKLVWEAMGDLKNPLPMMHDGYLKLFQLSGPKLWYDAILLDEAQDTNPVTQALVEAQGHARRIYVGDEHQAIYSFRGARNAMSQVQADAEFMLTGSFRFGSAVADLANELLEAKGETELRLRGLGAASKVGPLAPNTPHTYIARGNSALFARAVQALEDNERFSFVGPLYNYRLDLITQTFEFSCGNKVKDPFLSGFRDFVDLEEYAEAMEDHEWAGRCKLVNKYGKRIPFLVSKIQEKAGTYPGPGAQPQVVLTSAHRSKGLEFDQVIMANDFMDFFDEEAGQWLDFSNPSAHEVEGVNLQYVAATRAKRFLEIGEKLADFRIHHQSENAKKARAGVSNTARSKQIA